jgi:hypothetical protein
MNNSKENTDRRRRSGPRKMEETNGLSCLIERAGKKEETEEEIE